jgi:alcohol dehydrogenase
MRCARRTSPALAAAACREADFNYPVPRRMTQADAEAMLRALLPMPRARHPAAARRRESPQRLRRPQGLQEP